MPPKHSRTTSPRSSGISHSSGTTIDTITPKLVQVFRYAQHYSRAYLDSLKQQNPNQDWRPVFLATAELTSTLYATELLFYRVSFGTVESMLRKTMETKNFTVLKWILKNMDTHISIPSIVYTIDRKDILTIILVRFYDTQDDMDEQFLKMPKWIDLYLKYANPTRALYRYFDAVKIVDTEILLKILEKSVDWKKVDIRRMTNYGEKLTPAILELFVHHGFDVNVVNDPILQVFIKYFQAQLEKMAYTLSPGTQVLELMKEDSLDTTSFAFYKAYSAQILQK